VWLRGHQHQGVYGSKTFFLSLTLWTCKEVFVIGKHFQLALIFKAKVRLGQSHKSFFAINLLLLVN
jgi:hypothetical protein